MKLIVGLGNPGPDYEATRHNVGFDVVSHFAKRWSISMSSEKHHGWFGKGNFGGEGVLLLKPTTFMNRSGRAVLACGRFYKLEAEDLLVIADDFALPLGHLRIRKKGSAGSHNGLQDIIDRLGTNVWSRLRLGIGVTQRGPAGGTTGFVLGRFHESERALVTKMIDRATDAVESWISDGPDLAMTRFNGPVMEPDAKPDA